jgi:hypothetical protein
MRSWGWHPHAALSGTKKSRIVWAWRKRVKQGREKPKTHS